MLIPLNISRHFAFSQFTGSHAPDLSLNWIAMSLSWTKWRIIALACTCQQNQIIAYSTIKGCFHYGNMDWNVHDEGNKVCIDMKLPLGVCVYSFSRLTEYFYNTRVLLSTITKVIHTHVSSSAPNCSLCRKIGVFYYLIIYDIWDKQDTRPDLKACPKW